MSGDSGGQSTQIGTRNINMTITCESATGIAITARDTRMDSMTTGKEVMTPTY
ncbi:DUF1120 domain-containing protein [Escherichia coli]